jgi:hypothetical protein
MKTIALIIIILISVSCASSKQGECDAYGKVEKTENPS